MLFLYRPRQTWMPYRRPRAYTKQDAYNRNLQDAYSATRRVAAPAPATQSDPIATLKDLASLHDTGALTDAEFAAAKTKVLAGPDATADADA
jgi:Short C-terminal domain